MAEGKGAQPPTSGTGGGGPGISSHVGKQDDNPEGLALAKGEGGSNPDPTPVDPGQAFGKSTGAADKTSSGRGQAGVGKIPEPEEGKDKGPAKVDSGNKPKPDSSATEIPKNGS